MTDNIYKVVAAQWQQNEIVLTSCLDLLEPDWNVRYAPGLRTEPHYPGSYLYAFSDQDMALAYPKGAAEILKPQISLQVWEGQGQIVQASPVIGAWHSFKNFWDMQLFSIEDSWLGDWLTCPPGSVWCTWIKLTKLIQGEQPAKPPQKQRR